MEKEERKFYREVDKENDIRDRKKHEKEKKNREKEMFLKKFFPEINNSPGGTLNLKKSRLDITPGRKRAMGKTDDGISDVTPAKKTLTARNYSAEHLNFTHNDNSIRKILKVKLRTNTRLPNKSDQLSNESEADQSQERTGAKGSRY